MDSTPDADFIAAVLAGHSDQFAELVRRYRGALWRTARSRLNDVDLAEDAVQETFFNAFKHLATYDSRFSFRTWLWTILLNQCRRVLSKQFRRRECSTDDFREKQFLDGLDQRQMCPDDRAMLAERAEVLERQLADLPESLADALRLRFFGDLKFQEIADVLGCSLSTVKNRVREGLLQLAGRLADHEEMLPEERTA